MLRIAVRLRVSVWGYLCEHLGCHAPNFCNLLGGRSAGVAKGQGCLDFFDK